MISCTSGILYEKSSVWELRYFKSQQNLYTVRWASLPWATWDLLDLRLATKRIGLVVVKLSVSLTGKNLERGTHLTVFVKVLSYLGVYGKVSGT